MSEIHKNIELTIKVDEEEAYTLLAALKGYKSDGISNVSPFTDACILECASHLKASLEVALGI